MNNIEIVTDNTKETQKVGAILAREIIKSKKTLIVGLIGELGSGKTTFIQGMAKGLRIKERITSPTFVIMKRYIIPKKKVSSFYHIDCYRVQLKDLLDLGLKEIINQPENLIVIEWAEKVKKILPRDTFWIKFEYLDKDKRKIIL